MAVKYDPILDALREADTSGSSDTASNLGTGTGVYSYKNSGIFYFNSLATSTTIGISGPTSGAISLDLLSIPSALIPDPLDVNNLSVHSNASINVLTATTGNITNINTDITNYNTSYTITGSEAVGSVYWNSDRDTVQVNTNAGTLDVGEITVFHCINQTGSTINKGTAVMFAGSLGASGKMKIAPAVADGTYPSIVVLGITKENIADGDEGKVIFVGELKGFNTSVYGTAGQILYIDPATPGALTTTVPTAPNLKYPIAATLDSKSNGNLVVRAIFTPDLDELNDVQIGTLAGNDVLSYNSTNSRWENKSLATLKTDLDLSGTNTGDVTVTDSSTIDFTLTGQDITGSVIEGGITHNNLGSLQGGTAGEYNHLTNAQVTNLNNQSGTNTGDITVTDSATVNFTLTGQNLTADVIASGVSLSGLSDVNITSVQDEDLLKYEASSGKWVNTKYITVDSLTVTGSIVTNQSSAFYGDGSDGVIDFDGTNEYPNFSTFNGFDTYTLTRDIYASTLNVAFFVYLKTGGYRIFVSDTLVNTGYIHNNGNDAVNNTLGTGGAGGFFKAGANGVAGLGTATAGANGTVPTAQTNLVAGTGGRGQSAYSNQTAFEGLSPLTSTTTPPASAIGSSKMVNNVFAYQFSFIPSATNALMQFTPSQGGGAGAKSAAGTGATSGGGGGGGGTVFIAARSLVNFGVISASGGNGGDANGINANLGGGGGGGGGVVCVVYDTNTTLTLGDIRAFGGAGGLSYNHLNGTRAVAIPYHLQNSTAQTVYVTPANFMDKKSLYMISIHTFDDIISTIEHPNYKIELIDIVSYDTIATPTKYLQLYYAYFDPAVGEVVNQFENQSIKFTTLNGTCTNMKIVIDEIQNCDGTSLTYSHAINSSDSTTNLTVDLGYVPTTGNMVYSVFAKDGGSATATQGTGNTIIRQGSTIPYLYTEVSLNRQTNNLTWTTATQAAGISVDIDQVATMRDGVEGWDGKVVLLPQ